MSSKLKIRSIIERFFVVAAFIILTATLLGGWYFNRLDSLEKKKENLKKTHTMLSQLIVPSLAISDITEVRHLLYMASTETETYLVISSQKITIMPDYADYELAEIAQKLKDSCGHFQPQYMRVGRVGYLVNCSVLKADDRELDESKLGMLVSFSQYQDFSFSSMVGGMVGALFLFYLILIFLFRRTLYKNVIKPLICLKDQIRSVSLDGDILPAPVYEIDNAPEELFEISSAFERLLLKLREEYGNRIEVEKSNALIDLAAEVAHDIRSPLVALDVLIRDIKNIPEGQRVFIRHAANRIKDIANNLLAQYRQNKSELNELTQTIIKPELISDLLTSLVAEKRIQYRNQAVKLTLFLDEGSHGLFAMVSLANFNRSLSNLIDNCVEAESTSILVSLKVKTMKGNNLLCISVADNGRGLARPLQEKILVGEVVSTKQKGSGIGLSRTKRIVENEWKGSFGFDSTLNSGTTVSLELPQAPAPQWFLPFLQVSTIDTIVIVDDDESIHHVWKERFSEVGSGFKFIDFYCPDEMFGKFTRSTQGKTIFLVDYEFVSTEKTGISLIESLGVPSDSYLVTSRHEDVFVREEVERIGLKVIPKTYVAHIPISITASVNVKSADLVLIDDDVALVGAWMFRALQCGKIVEAYKSIDAFRYNSHQVNKQTPIYIDSELGGTIKGEVFAEELFEAGFTEIYLATGHDPSIFPTMPWVKAVVGKEPPF